MRATIEEDLASASNSLLNCDKFIRREKKRCCFVCEVVFVHPFLFIIQVKQIGQKKVAQKEKCSPTFEYVWKLQSIVVIAQ